MTGGTGEGRKAWVVRGRVQGVGFRWWARHTARGLGLRGTVRNARDGNVEVEAAGTPDALARFRAALSEGPPGARVAGLEEAEPGGMELPAGFEIVR